MLNKMPRRTAHPNGYIIAGSNGAGETTFATEFLPLYANCRNFINPDLIARAYSPFDPDAGMLRAGRTVLERIAEFTQPGPILPLKRRCRAERISPCFAG